MRKILTYHNVSPDFLMNLFCCGKHPQASEAGSGHFHASESPVGSSGEPTFDLVFAWLTIATENFRVDVYPKARRT